MRVLAVMTYPYDTVPGQRFRIEQWAPLLARDHGIDVTFRSFFDAPGYDIVKRPGRIGRKLQATLEGLGRRTRDVAFLRRWDAVFLYREAAPVGPAFYERLIARSIPYLLDFDDAIFLPQVSATNRAFAFAKSHRKVDAICRLASHITAGNEYLASYARKHNPHVTVIPTTIDTDRYVPDPHRKQPSVPIIGWTGSSTTIAYLDELRDAFAILARTHRFRVRIIGDAPRYSLPGIDVENVAWRAATEPEDLKGIDVGVMPLRDDEWSRGKCGAKALQYMALGIPAVCSPVGVNREIVAHGDNGFLASTTGEWVARLRELLDDAERRHRMGEAARRTVEDRYSARSQVPHVAALLRSLTAR